MNQSALLLSSFSCVALFSVNNSIQQCVTFFIKVRIASITFLIAICSCKKCFAISNEAILVLLYQPVMAKWEIYCRKCKQISHPA